MTVRTLRRGACALVLLAGCASAVPSTARCASADASADAHPDGSRWTVDLPGAPGALAVDGDGTIVTLDDRVRAMDPRGAPVWDQSVPGAGLDWPVIDRDLVVVPVTTDAGARCVGLDRATGSQRWQLDAGPGPVAATAVGAGVVVCASSAGRVIAAATTDGAPRWSVALTDLVDGREVALSPRSSLAIDVRTRTLAFTGAVGRAWALFALALDSGADAGRSMGLGAGAPPSAAATDGEGTLVVGDGSRKAVFVVDLVAGKVRAALPTRDAFDPASIPLVAGNRALVVDRGGSLTAVDLPEGRVRWRADLQVPVLDSRPVLAGSTVVLTDWVREVHAYRWADGREDRPPLAVPSVVALGADPAAEVLVAAGRGTTGNRLDGRQPSGNGRVRSLQCPSEPGQPTGQPARP
jgi:outer membrane protein assembly factor BamB